ncbi:MAG: cupin domain-containing protein [Terracidiphilus sp.]
MLTGVPKTTGMRSGFVRLTPGQTVGWHTTGKNEEALVVLHGRGRALIDGQPAIPFVAPALVYIPPATRHNVENVGPARWNTIMSSRQPSSENTSISNVLATFFAVFPPRFRQILLDQCVRPTPSSAVCDGRSIWAPNYFLKFAD